MFCQVIEEFTSFPFYISMPIDNTIWHARVGVFYALKNLSQKYQTLERFIIHLLHCCYLFYFITFQLFKFHFVHTCIIPVTCGR